MSLKVAIGREFGLQVRAMHRADSERIPVAAFTPDRWNEGPRRDGPTWASSDATKATVDNHGRVTGIAAGNATITATYTPLESGASPVSITMDVVVVADANQADSYYLELSQIPGQPVPEITGA